MDTSKPKLLILLEYGGIYDPSEVLSGTVFFFAPTSNILPYGDTLFLDYMCEDQCNKDVGVISDALKLTLQSFDDSQKQSWQNGQTIAYPFTLKLADHIPQTYTYDGKDGKYKLKHSLLAYFDYQKGETDIRSKTDSGYHTFTKIEFKVNSTRAVDLRPNNNLTILDFKQSTKDNGCLSGGKKFKSKCKFNITYPKVHDVTKGFDLLVQIRDGDEHIFQQIPYLTFFVDFIVKTNFKSYQKVDMFTFDLGKLECTGDIYNKEWKININSDKLPKDGTILINKPKKGWTRFECDCLMSIQLLIDNPKSKLLAYSSQKTHTIKIASPYVEKTGEPEYSQEPPEEFFEMEMIEYIPDYQKNSSSNEPTMIGDIEKGLVYYS